MPDDRSHEFDTIEERYQKSKFVVQKFIAFQIGLTCFKWDQSIKKYLARPFTFYVYPRSKVND
jgi:poly(A)-specific ribonuclease